MVFGKEKNWLPLALSLMLSFMLLVSGRSADAAAPNSESAINSFTIVNADTDKDITTSAKEGKIALNKTPRINIRANVQKAGSVVFKNGKTENVAPFAYMGDIKGNYNAWSPKPGTYVITATAYSQAGGKGTKLSEATFTLSVSAGGLPAPSKSPTAKPIQTPTATPSKSPTAKPIQTPTATPSKSPTAKPIQTPTATPSKSPTAKPIQTPTVTPSKSPTTKPTTPPVSALPPVFAAQCAACHGVNGSGGIFVALQNYTKTLTQMTTVIRNGKVPMPAYLDTVVTDADIAKMYAFFSGKPASIPTTTPTKAPAATPTAAPIGEFPSAVEFFPNPNFKSAANRLYPITKPQLVAIFNQIMQTKLAPDTLGYDPKIGGFRTDASIFEITNQFIDDIEKLTQTHSSKITEKGVQNFMQCAATATVSCTNTDCKCVDSFLSRITQIAFGRFINQSERDAYLSLYRKIDAVSNDKDAIQYLIFAVLTDSSTLLRKEIGVSSDEMILSKAYLAATNLPAPPALMTNASTIVNSKLEFEKQVSSWLNSSDGRKMVKVFLQQWLGIDDKEVAGLVPKDKNTFPTFDSLKDDMVLELNGFLDHVVSQDKITLNALLTSRYSVLTRDLASFYKEGNAGVSQMSEKRKGILTKGYFLALNGTPIGTHPTKRGEKILNNLLCYKTAGLPADVDLPTDNSGVKRTTREQFERHATDPLCASCHQVMDPLGFGLENYDGDGSYRLSEVGFPVNAASSLTALPFTTNLSFDGPSDMIDQVAETPEIKACLVRQVFRYTQGREERSEDDQILADALEKFKKEGWNIRAVFESILTNPLNY